MRPESESVMTYISSLPARLRVAILALVALTFAATASAQFDPAGAITDATTAVTGFGALLVPLMAAFAALAVGVRLLRRYVG